MTAEKKKYEFGRHETFSLRDGWLSKGVMRVLDGSFKVDVETADALGLGRNMVKSLMFWLEASGMAQRGLDGKAAILTATPLARAVMERDPHFEFAVSNWFAHLWIARREATVWNWYFNDFRSGSFEREAAVEAFHRHVRQHAPNQTTVQVLQREVACVLDTYSALPPNEAVDPEDNRFSPLRALRLTLKHHDTGRFEKSSPLDQVPVEVFLAAVKMLSDDAGAPSLPLSELISRRNSPARLFNVDGDAIDALAGRAEELYGGEGVRVTLLGSTRTISVPPTTPLEWYARHFNRIGV
jgi:hypothetical protein